MNFEKIGQLTAELTAPPGSDFSCYKAGTTYVVKHQAGHKERVRTFRSDDLAEVLEQAAEKLRMRQKAEKAGER